jgi:hypothetical protein
MALLSPKFERKNLRFVCCVPVCTCRLVKNCSSPSLLVVLLTLNSFHGSDNCLIGSLRYFVYLIFIKFSMAPKSTSAIDSALFNFKYMKKWTVIDFLLDIFTSVVSLHLISANLIRLEENPVLLPSFQQASHSLRAIEHQSCYKLFFTFPFHFS